MTRYRGFQSVLLLMLGLLMSGCSLPSASVASNSVPTTTPSLVLASEPTPVLATARRATAQPRATATRQPRTTATAQRATARPRATASPRTTPTAPAATAPPVAQPVPGFRTVAPDRLPREARQTLTLIDQGGPFPYRQDGVVFQNRERRLPRQANGYYHEYTVTTPGEGDRGARRIITGANGERFYTDDHYNSFVQVLP